MLNVGDLGRSCHFILLWWVQNIWMRSLYWPRLIFSPYLGTLMFNILKAGISVLVFNTLFCLEWDYHLLALPWNCNSFFFYRMVHNLDDII
uniref:Uncharacterized protein n=1 Tax=Rhizophora mucronata TaxID=61149 RepID=A0A2P2P7C8_RHIMU